MGIEGRLDSATKDLVKGWAYDKMGTSLSCFVAITVDGVDAAVIPTDKLREDVNRIKGVTGNHGYEWVPVGLADGKPHVIRVYGIPLNGGPRQQLNQSPKTLTILHD